MTVGIIEVIQRLGDVCAEDHGGGAVIRTEDGYLYLEWTHGLESEHPGEERYADEVGDLKLEVFRVSLDEPAWVALSGCGDEAKLWAACADCSGLEVAEAVRLAKSSDPLEMAGAFELFAGRHGWRELDCYPETMTYAEVSERWEGWARYRITSEAGVHMGTWPARSPEEATEMMHRDAGYKSAADAARQLGLTVEGLHSGLCVEEIR